jgi:hypothetical protein
MTNEQEIINKAIHKFLKPSECWHQFPREAWTLTVECENGCGAKTRLTDQPKSANYCESHDLLHEVLLKMVAEQKQLKVFVNALMDASNQVESEYLTYEAIAEILTFSTEQKAKAIFEVIKNETN